MNYTNTTIVAVIGVGHLVQRSSRNKTLTHGPTCSYSLHTPALKQYIYLPDRRPIILVGTLAPNIDHFSVFRHYLYRASVRHARFIPKLKYLQPMRGKSCLVFIIIITISNCCSPTIMNFATCIVGRYCFSYRRYR